MRANYDKTISNLLQELRELTRDLPKGKRNQLDNRLGKLGLTFKKKHTMDTMKDMSTQRQIADRYIAKKAIFEAMMNGRRISFLDSAEFEVSEMHTQMHCIRKDIEDKALPVTLKDEWMEFGKHGKRCKVYWIEKNNQQSIN